MQVSIHPDARSASEAAAGWLVRLLADPATRTLVAAAGNSPRTLYRLLAESGLNLSRLHVFALDEYLDVPLEDPRTCARLLEREVALAWKIASGNYHPLTSRQEEAGAALNRHSRLLEELGGIDVLVLGLGQNGHLGFNEPGTPADWPGGIVELEASSVEANRQWFSGEYAPHRGVTLGLGRLLSSRHVLLIAYGRAKATAVRRMRGAPDTSCPASWLQRHPNARVFLDREAAGE